MKAIVLTRGGYNGLGVVRALGRNNIPVTVLSPFSNDIAGKSKYSEFMLCPNLLEDKSGFLDFMISLGAKSAEKAVVFATFDAAVNLILNNKNYLDKYYYFPLPSSEIGLKIIDKRRLSKLLLDCGIPHPRTFDLKDILQGQNMKCINFPCVVKPVFPNSFALKFNVKCFKAQNEKQLRKIIKLAFDSGEEIFAQEIIPGSELYMFYAYFDNYSEPVGICGYKKIRQNPLDFGTATLCESAWYQEPVDLGLKLLRDVKYSGIAEPEFKKDPRDGKWKLIEINIRPVTLNRLSARCGVDIELLAYKNIAGEAISKCLIPQNGIKWIDFRSDSILSAKLFLTGKLSFLGWLRSLRGIKSSSTLAFDDLRPFFVSYLRFLIDFFKSLTMRISNKLKASSLNKKPKIALIGPFFPALGGMSVQAEALKDSLEKDSYSVISINTAAKTKAIFEARGLRTILNFFRLVFNITLRGNNCSVFYVFGCSYGYFWLVVFPTVIIGKLLGKRVIINYHGGAANDFLTKYRFFLKRIFLWADKIIVPSGYLKAIFLKFGIKSEVISNIIDTDRFNFKKRLNPSPNIIVTRNHESCYGIEKAIEVFADIKHKIPDAKLTLVGSGSQTNYLRKIVDNQKLLGVEFLGKVDNSEMPAVLARHDIFLNTSKHDNMPLSILEAFSSGLCVVSSKAGGIPYLVKDGDTGFLAEVSSCSALADKIFFLLNNPEKFTQIAENARKEVEKYSWSSIRNLFFDVVICNGKEKSNPNCKNVK